MDVIRLIGIGLIICLISVTLRGRNPEFALMVSLVGGIGMLFLMLGAAGQVVDYLNGMLAQFNVPGDSFLVLIKCLGLSYLGKIACDMCNDCGETSTGTKVELAAKIGILLTAVPIFEQLLGTITQFAV